MKGRLRCFLAPAGLFLLCLSLVGCSITAPTMTTFDATSYVQGVLDETYKGTWNNAFLDLVDLTDGEAQDAYEAALDQEYDRFAYQFQLDDAALTEETRQAVQDLLRDLCAKAQYAVKTVAPLDDTRYAVEVSVRPLDLFLQVRTDSLGDFQEEFALRYAEVDQDRLSQEEQRQLRLDYENDWALGIVGLCRDTMGLMQQMDVVPILVLVAPDEKGIYAMGDNDFANLSALILPY